MATTTEKNVNRLSSQVGGGTGRVMVFDATFNNISVKPKYQGIPVTSDS